MNTHERHPPGLADDTARGPSQMRNAARRMGTAVVAMLVGFAIVVVTILVL